MWALQFTLLCLTKRPNRTEKVKKRGANEVFEDNPSGIIVIVFTRYALCFLHINKVYGNCRVWLYGVFLSSKQ